jgi:zinc protease
VYSKYSRAAITKVNLRNCVHPKGGRAEGPFITATALAEEPAAMQSVPLTAQDIFRVSMLEDVTEFQSNGLRVVFATRQNSPLVELRFISDGGFASDPTGLSGLAGFAMAMVSEGALRIRGTPVTIALESLGAVVHSSVSADAAVVSLSALAAKLNHTLDCYFELISRAEFKADDVELMRSNRLALIAHERRNSFILPIRILPPRLYGQDHPYARPLSGSGSEAGVAAITADDLHLYYAKHLVPKILVVVGPGSPESLLELLGPLWERWFAVASDISPADCLPPPFARPSAPAALVVDRPSSPQAAIATGLLSLPRNSGRAEALMVADAILGGTFSSRLNLSLRENKGWTYGVRSTLFDARMLGVWLIRSLVEHKRAGAAIAEIANEFQNLAGRQPCTPDEFTRAVNYLVARIPCMHETGAQMADSLVHTAIYGLPLAHPRELAARLRAVTSSEINEVCHQVLAAASPCWMVAGKADQLIDQLTDVGICTPEVESEDTVDV